MIADSERSQLEERGYVVLEDFIAPDRLERLRERVEEVYSAEGERAGSEFRHEDHVRRLANLVAKGEIFEDLVSDPEILERVGCVLGSDFKLSSLNARSANPFENCRQPLHVDAGAIADERGYWVCNTIWLLDDFTPENGATRCVPGSHKWRMNPVAAVADPLAPHPEEILVAARAGAVVVMNAHLWHGGTENRTALPRRAIHAFYCRNDKPQQQYQKALIPPDVQERFRPEVRRILALDDSQNDLISSQSTGASGFLK
jgi:ectoine hydroxylase-related dioxygenase (phytanoyl-CoA dioxygenase family)